MDTVCDTPPPGIVTVLLVCLEECRNKTIWIATYVAGTWNVANMVCVMRSRFALRFRRASVGEAGCSSGVIIFMSVQFVTIPCSMGYFNSQLVAAVAARHP